MTERASSLGGRYSLHCWVPHTSVTSTLLTNLLQQSDFGVEDDYIEVPITNLLTESTFCRLPERLIAVTFDLLGSLPGRHHYPVNLLVRADVVIYRFHN